MITSHPNFSKVYSAANEILVKTNAISTFPFDAVEVVRGESDISFCSYSKAMNDFSVNIPKFGSDSAIIIEYRGMHIIFCNDKHSIERQRWSIIHEFGHYILNHKMNLDVDNPLYVRQEIEANYFAAQLLMPEQIIREFISRGYSITSGFLMKSFDVTEEAAKKRINTMNNYDPSWRSKKESEYDDVILQKYLSLIEKVAPSLNKYNFEDELELEKERSNWF